MKQELSDQEEETRAKSIFEQCWLGPLCLGFWVLVIVAIFLLCGCGGTIAIYPDGSVRYTTPQIIKPTIVPQK